MSGVTPINKRELELKRDFYAEFNKMSLRSRIINEGIDTIAPDVFKVVKEEFENKKISAATAVNMLTRLLNSANRLDHTRLSMYKQFKKDGVFLPLADKKVEKALAESTQIAKTAERMLTEAIKQKIANQA